MCIYSYNKFSDFTLWCAKHPGVFGVVFKWLQLTRTGYRNGNRAPRSAMTRRWESKWNIWKMMDMVVDDGIWWNVIWIYVQYAYIIIYSEYTCSVNWCEIEGTLWYLVFVQKQFVWETCYPFPIDKFMIMKFWDSLLSGRLQRGCSDV